MRVELNKMKEYHDRTTINGIIMPTVDEFDKKVFMAIRIWPQINDNGEIDYLLGKGVGAELAIRGTVVGRKKNNNDFSYRSHSDFEIYDCNGYDKLPQSSLFTYVFGGQEYYPKDATKGLKKMDPKLMDETYEKVIYNGETYLIPQLEILFLDKFIKQESTPRKEGCDALLLLKEYELDLDKILYYFDEYYFKVESERIFKITPDELYQTCINSLTKRMPQSCKEALEEDGIEVNFDNLTKKIEKNLSIYRKMASKSVIIEGGMPMDCCPLKIEYVSKPDGTLDLTEETKKEIKNLIANKYKTALNPLINERKLLIKIHNELYPNHKKSKKSKKI